MISLTTGIHRGVMLYTTPNITVDHITVVTRVTPVVTTHLLTGRWGRMVMSALNSVMRINRWSTGQGASGTLQVVNPHLWQPGEGYLYQLCFAAKSQAECDIYLLRVGIRSVAVKGEQFLINHKPFSFTGFGSHEDADLRGKGFDNVLMVPISH
ncbi:glycoside hydrolase family 2 TIM barrel-domain containing protein [Shigella sonnei]